jgi:hypothetical protein
MLHPTTPNLSGETPPSIITSQTTCEPNYFQWESDVRGYYQSEYQIQYKHPAIVKYRSCSFRLSHSNPSLKKSFQASGSCQLSSRSNQQNPS